MFAKLIATMMLCSTLYSLPSYAVAQPATDMSTHIDELIQTAGKDPYHLSLPLIASALERDNRAYRASLDKLLAGIGIGSRQELIQIDMPDLILDIDSFSTKMDLPISFSTWLLGRVIYSAERIGDDVLAARTADLMQYFLEQTSVEQDTFSAWARGYLAAYFAKYQPDDYAVQKQHLLSDVREVANQANDQTISDALWAWVLQLNAAAVANDQALYNQTITAMLQKTRTSQLGAALDRIPSSDYRAWAVSIAQLAAMKMHDKQTVKALQQPLQNAVVLAPNQADRILALLTNTQAKQG